MNDDDWILPPSRSIDSANRPTPEPEPVGPPSFGRAPPPKPPKRPGPNWRDGFGGGRGRWIWGSLGVVAAILVVTAIVGVITVGRFLADVPQIPDKSELTVVNQAPGMTFEDRDGHVLATRGPKHGYAISLSELPTYVPQAFLAAEDRRFYHHGAVDFRGMARAAWANWRAHRTVQGGSTLTQQLAKTLFLTPDQTLKRKLQEAVIAGRLEKEMSKDEVLELYLNRIFFGDNAYGIDAASQTYFGKPARQLSLPEAALLASLPKAPTRLALTNDMDAALQRSHLVLHNMRAEGWITADQEQAALDSPPKLAPEAQGEGDFGYVIDMASAEAVKIAGGQAPDLVVRLSIDQSLQSQAQAIVRQTIATEGHAAHVKQGALVLLAPDGGIRALVGGVDHHLSAFNRATQAQRQPGSSFKPFVYAAALAHSINTVAAQLANEVGSPKLGEISHRFGLKDIPDDPNLSVALGTYEVNLLELAGAYEVFQQGGQRTEPYLIDQIATTRGDVLYTHVASAGAPVYDVAHAGDMVRMMEGVITHGTATRAAFGRPAAGKTGTTQNWRDAWFMGFTPDWMCGVWIGNDDNTPMNKITGGNIPAEIWRKMMLLAHQGAPVRDFAWLPPETPADTVSDAPPSDEPAATSAAEDTKSGFYKDLSSDFSNAQRGTPPAQPGDTPRTQDDSDDNDDPDTPPPRPPQYTPPGQPNPQP